ncbi:MAG: hypothetical protein IJ298_06880 [Ruminococcus sp.]|nr:hypothetical protein [Ruminococcus sp.]
MKKRIFTGTFFTCICVILVCIILISGFLYRYYSNEYTKSLHTSLDYLHHMVEEHGTEHLSTLASNQQLCLVSPDGSVVVASEGVSPMPQLTKKVQSLGEGVHSEHLSISKKQTGVGVLLEDESVLCIFGVQHTFVSLLAHMYGYILVILGVAVLLSLLLARKISQKILEPVYNLDLSAPDKSKVYPELAHFVDKINEQNQEIQRQLADNDARHEQQDRMRREFTANVSHELKTPLTSISGYAEIIRDGLVQPQDIPRFAGRIYDESKRMINLVGDIIKLSQLDENEITVKMERINLYACCEAVITNLQPQAKKKNVTFTLQGDRAEITGAEVIIDEIVYNICDNAVKYNRDGGTVLVTVRQCIDGVELTVKDTGIGIAKDDIDHIFDRFYRADKSHSKEIGGTGLGLSIVKHGAMFHNASVSVESEVGVGTTIRILF